MNKTFGISELAREFGVTTRTIRFYEDQGLLCPARAKQNRIYAPRDRVRLKLILRGKRLGFSLREIQDMLDLYDAPSGEYGQLRHFVDKMRERRAELTAQRDDIESVLDELQVLESRCLNLLDDGIDAADRATTAPREAEQHGSVDSGGRAA